MPRTEVILFAEEDGACPLLNWLDNGRLVIARARTKCIVKIERLAEHGHARRRPDTDYLRDDIYELRARLGHVNYRMLYFFHEGVAVLTHGLTKEDKVPAREIDLAIARMRLFQKDPQKHTYRE